MKLSAIIFAGILAVALLVCAVSATYVFARDGAYGNMPMGSTRLHSQGESALNGPQHAMSGWSFMHGDHNGHDQRTENHDARHKTMHQQHERGSSERNSTHNMNNRLHKDGDTIHHNANSWRGHVNHRSY